MTSDRGLQRKVLDTKDVTNVRQQFIKTAFDKTNRTSALLKIIYLDTELDVLRVSVASNPRYEKVTPGTVGEHKFESVFKALAE